MYVRFDYIKKDHLLKQFGSLPGADFLMDFNKYVSKHDVPMGEELEILWHGVRVVAVLFDRSDLLLLKIQQKKSDTPSLSQHEGEPQFCPTNKKWRVVL